MRPAVSVRRGISERHGGRPLILLDHENTTRGDRSLRVMFAAWWEERAGREVLELSDDGRDLRYDVLPKRTHPKRPKDWTADGRWRDDGALGLSWPLSEGDLRRWWIALRHWQAARSQNNPHAYTVRHWGDDRTFWLVVQHMREHGEQEVWGGQLFTYYVCDGTKFWTMGADLMSTVILNRKPFGQDPQDREKGAGRGGDAPLTEPFEAALFDRHGRPTTLAERINAEHRACALAAGSALRHAVRCGGLLYEAKSGVKHGNWLPWLRENTDLEPRTAQLYMQLHRESSEATGEAESVGGTTLRPANTQAITHSEAETTRRETA